MKIEVKRFAYKGTYTVGKLYIDGVFQCNTLEDKVRLLPEFCPNTPKGLDCKCPQKVWGQTAIPAGIYDVEIIYSPKFKIKAPHLLNVPHFIGILLHPGNTAVDTNGCLLVGKNTEVGMVTSSRIAFWEIMKLLNSATDQITIEIS